MHWEESQGVWYLLLFLNCCNSFVVRVCGGEGVAATRLGWGGEGPAMRPSRAQGPLCVLVAGADRNSSPLWPHGLNSWQEVPETLSGSVCGDGSQW